MKHKKLLAIFLTSIFTIGVAIAYHSFGGNDFLFNAEADKPLFTKTLSAENGPNLGAPQIGMIESENVTCYYSTNSDLENDSFLVLSATNPKMPGVFLNLTVINGLKSVKVNFSGGTLYAIGSETCFERFTPDLGDELTSEVTKTFTGEKNGYLLIITNSLTDVTIDSVTIQFYCSNEVDADFAFVPSVNNYTGSRSLAQDIFLEHDAIRFQTNPTETTNNYSAGTYAGHNNYWYRYNGVTPSNYALDGGIHNYATTPKGEFVSDCFEVVISVMVDPSIFYNPTAWFCLAPWVALATSNHQILPDAGSYVWMQSYIGNDNFDPIGGVNLLGRTDTYQGRFFTNFAAGGGGYDWGFQNPDTTMVIGDSKTTLREAYEAINLPFFNVRFFVDGNSYSLFINGFEIYHEDEAFYLAENYTNQKFSLECFELQAVNYGDGVDSDGAGPDTIASPRMPGGYGVAYTNPIVREVERII